jgi:hypothetical protein
VGFSISWLAFAPGAPAPLRQLRLADTGRPASPGVAPQAGARLANGWYVVAWAGFGHAEVEPMNAESRSWETRVVACTAGESVNTSSAALYVDGEQQWAVTHILDQGRDHLDIDGTPPAGAAKQLAIARRLAAKDGFDAVFSVPMILAQDECGFRHDVHHGAVFTELEAVPLLTPQAVAQTLLPLMRRVLESRGFDCIAATPSGGAFLRDRDEHRVECSVGLEPGSAGGCCVNVPAIVRNLRAQRAVAAACGDVEAAKPMYRGRFAEATTLPYFVTTAPELAEWTSRAEAELGDWADRLADVKALDALVNDGRVRYNFLGAPYEAHYDLDTGYAPLAIAYLAGNPRFASMVEQTARQLRESAPDEEAQVRRLVRELEALPRAV